MYAYFYYSYFWQYAYLYLYVDRLNKENYFISVVIYYSDQNVCPIIGISNAKMKSKPEIRNPKPETRNPKPETRNLK